MSTKLPLVVTHMALLGFEIRRFEFQYSAMVEYCIWEPFGSGMRCTWRWMRDQYWKPTDDLAYTISVTRAIRVSWEEMPSKAWEHFPPELLRRL